MCILSQAVKRHIGPCHFSFLLFNHYLFFSFFLSLSFLFHFLRKQQNNMTSLGKFIGMEKFYLASSFLVIFFFLLAVWLMPRATQGLHLNSNQKLPFHKRIINQHVPIYFLSIYYYLMGIMPYPSTIKFSGSMTGNWRMYVGNVRTLGPNSDFTILTAVYCIYWAY